VSDLAIRLVLGFLPVVLFLVGLMSLDSFKLVRLRAALGTIAVGAAAAAIAYLVNSFLVVALNLPPGPFSRYVAPVPEETLKALAIVVLIRSHRVGFLVDAAIFGFGVGAGFALAENLYYLASLPDMSLPVWVIRGFGTAILHGGTMALFGILSKSLADRKPSLGPAVFLPGGLAAVVLHSIFNHFLLSPVASTLAILVVLPVAVVFVFRRSEESLRGWLGVGFDADAELLDLIHSGRLSESRVGQYLKTLRESFRGEVVADMLCYLRLHTELSLRAKGELMMREAGFRSEIEPDIREKFQEMKFLERSIGATGRLAMLPFLHVSGKALWQLTMLREE